MLNSDASDDGASPSLGDLGWQEFFSRQVDAGQMAATPPVRITEVHRSGLRALGDGIDTSIPPGPEATVGDWLLLDGDHPASSRVLERKSLIKRRAAGHEDRVQLIAANIDTAFIVSSCNPDFNVARLERYIALAFEAGVAPVIVLTKIDLCDSPAVFVEAAERISDQIPVVTLDARGSEPAAKLAPWCAAGETVAFLGSSGVGKSTLANALTGTGDIATQAIRETDAKGRHTTTHRQLHFVRGGCAVLDTPGMREIQLAETEAGVAEVFADLDELAAGCRFNDCSHEVEPGCAVRAAIEAGEAERDRVERWQKLVVEERENSETLAVRRSGNKGLGKALRAVQKKNRK